jgi:hypothetical protein
MRFPIQAAAVIRQATSQRVRRLPEVGIGPQRFLKDLATFGFDQSVPCKGGNFWCYCPKSGSGKHNYACCKIQDPTDATKSCDQTTTGDCACTGPQ